MQRRGFVAAGQQVAGRILAVERLEEDANVVSHRLVRGEAHVLDEYGPGLVAIMFGDDPCHDVNHRDIECQRVGHRMFEVFPEIGLPAGDRRQPALAPRGVPEGRVEQDHPDARVV